MSQTYRGADPTTRPVTERNAWAVGRTVFAGVLMTVQGSWWFMAGLVAPQPTCRAGQLVDERGDLGLRHLTQGGGRSP